MAAQLSVPGAYRPPLPKLLGTPLPPQMIISLPVQTAVWEYRGAGAPAVLMATQLSVPGAYRPPLPKPGNTPIPPQTIISLPVHTAEWPLRPEGMARLGGTDQVS
jgi:hypothetical protein